MSRAIPANYDEYILDHTTKNTGIICDGGIMPLRTSNDPTSLQHRNCLRGEDLLFLNEATIARTYATSNSGFSDNAIRKTNLNTLNVRMKNLLEGGYYNATDPCDAIGWINLGTQYPDGDEIARMLYAKFTPLTQYSKYDTYDTLESEPIMNLFRDLKQLNYYLVNAGGLLTSWPFDKTGGGTLHQYRFIGHIDGTSRTTNRD
jgi:hypothetical protein